MSSRHSGYSRENTKCLESLAEYRKKPGNRICAECGDKSATWCSTNLGVFVCIRCSGIHRQMGTHISKVKSSTLDKWTYDLVDAFKKCGGNKQINIIYEAKMPGGRKPSPQAHIDDVERFIRDKYQHKVWYSKRKARRWARQQEEEEDDMTEEEESEEESESSATRRRRRRRERRKSKKHRKSKYESETPTPSPQPKTNGTSKRVVKEQETADFFDESSFGLQPQAPPQDDWTEFDGGFKAQTKPNTSQGGGQGDNLFDFSSSQTQTQQQSFQGGQQQAPVQVQQQFVQNNFFGVSPQQQEKEQVQVDPEKLKKSRNSILEKFHQKPQTQFMTQLPPNMAMQQGLMNPAQVQQYQQMQQMKQMQMQQMRMQQMQQQQRQPPKNVNPMALYKQQSQPQIYGGMPQQQGFQQQSFGMQGMQPMQQFPQQQFQQQGFSQGYGQQGFQQQGFQQQRLPPQLQQNQNMGMGMGMSQGFQAKPQFGSQQQNNDKLFADLM